MQSEKPQEQWVYKNTVHCFAKVLKDEGLTAFFKGAGANALRTVGSAMVLVLYDQFQGLLGVSRGRGGGE
jgi:solute carrier family 25 (adenine nucleotide translocator) protein 4/5/6/31